MHLIVALWLAVASQQQKCQEQFAPLLKTAKGDALLTAYSQLGGCLDDAGARDEALATFRRGLKIAPNDATLNFNLGVTLSHMEDYDGTRLALERSLRAFPHQRDGMLLLGIAFEKRNYRVQAILADLRFLAMEPEGERAQAVARKVIDLLNSGGPKPERRPAEGDFGVGELLLSLAKEPGRDLDTLQREVLSLLNVLYDPHPDITNFTSQINMPFFKELVDRQLTDDFVVIAFSSVAPAGSKDWLDAHGDSIRKTIDFINEQNH